MLQLFYTCIFSGRNLHLVDTLEDIFIFIPSFFNAEANTIEKLHEIGKNTILEKCTVFISSYLLFYYILCKFYIFHTQKIDNE